MEKKQSSSKSLIAAAVCCSAIGMIICTAMLVGLVRAILG